MVSIGKKVASFSAESTAGKKFKLTDYAGKYVICFFYPRDDTPGCTTENIEFTTHKTEFEHLNVELIGISRDTIAAHEKFIAKHKLNVTLLADTDEKICQKFAVLKEKNMYGKKVIGIERSTFIIGPDQVLIHEWRKVKVEGHVDEVLRFMENLS